MNKVSGNDQLNGQLASIGTDKSNRVASAREKRQNQKLKSARAESYDVDLSNQSKTVRSQHKKAYDIARATPDVREQKVADLKEKIKNGTYQIDSGKIADGILKEAIRDHLAASD
ncbi:MAG: flagellar biosynthesis anti-sigma factor FlgM [Oligoflexales bacterium]|nr:flagellar biosynthesis anti-sigma factor FlgM [Oligoflexales bacterium]